MQKTKLSFFYNHGSEEIVNASCNNHDFAEWFINHQEALNIHADISAYKSNPEAYSKVAKRELYAFGWSHVYINDTYCSIHSSNIEEAKKLLHMVGQENKLKTAQLALEDFHALFLEEEDMKVFLNTGKFGNHIFDYNLEQNKELNNLIKELKLLDCTNQTFVFGSICRGKISPPDLDIWIDATSIPVTEETKATLLELVGKYYVRLDPFINTPSSLLAVDSNIFTWQFNWIDLRNTEKFNLVKNVEEWAENAKNGIPLNELELLPATIEELLKNTVEKKEQPNNKKMKI